MFFFEFFKWFYYLIRFEIFFFFVKFVSLVLGLIKKSRNSFFYFQFELGILVILSLVWRGQNRIYRRGDNELGIKDDL